MKEENIGGREEVKSEIKVVQFPSLVTLGLVLATLSII